MNSNNTAFVNFVSLPLLVLRASISAWLTLVAVGQNILLLLVSRPTILLLLKCRIFQIWKRNSMSIDLVHEWFFKQKFEYLHNNPCQPHWQLRPSCRWSKYFVIVGLPTNNLAAEYPISGFRIIFKHEIGASSCSVLHRCMQ